MKSEHLTGTAPYDQEFEVTWLSDREVREGSSERGFRTVRVIGYELDLIYRAAVTAENGARWKLTTTE
jgi:hypothetical protein